MLRFRKLVCFWSPRDTAHSLSLIDRLQKVTCFLQRNFFKEVNVKIGVFFYDVLGPKIYDENLVVMVL